MQMPDQLATMDAQQLRELAASLIERLAGDMAQAFLPGMAPDELLRAFIHRQGRSLDASPRLRKLIGRELIDHDAAHAQAAIRHLAASTFDRLRAAIGAGQRSGLFRADIDPRFAAISIVGQTAYFHFARPAVEIGERRGKQRRRSAARLLQKRADQRAQRGRAGTDAGEGEGLTSRRTHRAAAPSPRRCPRGRPRARTART